VVATIRGGVEGSAVVEQIPEFQEQAPGGGWSISGVLNSWWGTHTKKGISRRPRYL